MPYATINLTPPNPPFQPIGTVSGNLMPLNDDGTHGKVPYSYTPVLWPRKITKSGNVLLIYSTTSDEFVLLGTNPAGTNPLVAGYTFVDGIFNAISPTTPLSAGNSDMQSGDISPHGTLAFYSSYYGAISDMNDSGVVVGADGFGAGEDWVSNPSAQSINGNVYSTSRQAPTFINDDGTILGVDFSSYVPLSWKNANSGATPINFSFQLPNVANPLTTALPTAISSDGTQQIYDNSQYYILNNLSSPFLGIQLLPYQYTINTPSGAVYPAPGGINNSGRYIPNATAYQSIDSSGGKSTLTAITSPVYADGLLGIPLEVSPLLEGGQTLAINNGFDILGEKASGQFALYTWTATGAPTQGYPSGPGSYTENLLNITIPTGWTVASIGTGDSMNDSRALIGTITNGSTAAPAEFVPCALLVDANRDGFIDNNDVGATSATAPFRFWINDDDDTELLPGPNIPLEADTVPIVTMDYTKHQIVSQRNLEDFARLWVYIGGLQTALTSGNIQVGLKWQSTNGTTPAINVYLSADPNGSDSYLTDTSLTAAQNQIAGGFNNAIVDVNGKLTVDTTGTFIFPAGYWSTLTQANPILHLLFEGAGVGTGQLAIVFLDKNGNQIGQGPGVWLDLRNIKEMYQQFGATPTTLPAPFNSSTGPFDSTQVSFQAYPNRPTFVAPVSEDTKLLVLVNGSNESYLDSTNRAETFFKRLWWQGYKGRFVSFRWETLLGPFNGGLPGDYNLNEWLAWNWGKGLRDYLASPNVPSGYVVNVSAHSLGNTVVASALQLGMQASNILCLQGAVPAGCFDTSGGQNDPTSINGYPPMWARETVNPTPDTASALGYRGFVASAGNATTYNFLNTDDYALATGPLQAWEGNQELTRPDQLNILTSTVPDTIYSYDAVTAGLPVTQRGQLFDTESATTIRFVATPYESMSFIARSRSKALGAVAGVGGVININVNIGPESSTNLQGARESGTNLQGTRADHSGEFTRNIQALQPFYSEFTKDIGAVPVQ